MPWSYRFWDRHRGHFVDDRGQVDVSFDGTPIGRGVYGVWTTGLVEGPEVDFTSACDLVCGPEVDFDAPTGADRRSLLARLVGFARGRLPKSAHAGLGNCGIGPRGFLPGNTCSRKHGAHGTGRGGTNKHRALLAQRIRSLRKQARTPEQRKQLAAAIRTLKAHERGVPGASAAAAKIRRAIHAGKIPKSDHTAIPKPLVVKPPKPPVVKPPATPKPPAVKPPTPKPPAPDRTAARVKRSHDRMAELTRQHAPAAAEVARTKAEYDRFKGSTAFTPERKAAQQAYFAADTKLRQIERELKQHAAYHAAVADRPSLVPPGPIADRLADYVEGEAHLQRVKAAVQPHLDRAERLTREIDAGMRERSQALDAAEKIQSQINGLGPRVPKAKRAALEVQHAEADAKYQALFDRRDALKAELAGNRDRIREAVADALAVDRPVQIAWEHRDIPHGEDGPLTRLAGPIKDRADAAAAWVSKITREGDDGPDLTTAIGMRKGQRAYHMAGDHIALSTDSPADVAVHELGHRLEDAIRFGGSQVVDRSYEFLNHRVGSEALVSLKDRAGPGSSYKDSERGRKDKFDQAFDEHKAYYVGKDYGSRATEILSMGLQKLYEDPVKFINKDKEYAKYVIGVLQGDLR